MRSPAFTRRSYAVLARLSPGYPPLLGTFRCITHPFATRHQGCPRAAVRLACVRHAASVQSEPGSNSSVRFCVLDFSRWNRGHLDVAIGMISSSSLREHLWFEHAGALRRETPHAGCALIKRPHLSAVSLLKSVADFLAGTDFYCGATVRKQRRGESMRPCKKPVKQARRGKALSVLSKGTGLLSPQRLAPDAGPLPRCAERRF